MASHRTPRSGPVSLHEIRKEQRRVAALLGASGQVEVSFPAHNGIQPKDLFKGQLYRNIQAGRPLTNGRVLPLGHQLRGHPHSEAIDQDGTDVITALVNGDGGQPSSGVKRALSTSLPASIWSSNEQRSRRQLRTLRGKTNVDSIAISDNIQCGDMRNVRSCQTKSFSNLEALPGIGNRTPAVDLANSPRVDYRLPRRNHAPDVKPELMAPPHLHYNLGDSQPPGNFDPLVDIVQSYSSSGLTRDGTLRGRGHRNRRKKKHHHNLLECNSNSSSSASSSSSSTSRSQTAPLEEEIGDDTPIVNNESDVDQLTSFSNPDTALNDDENTSVDKLIATSSESSAEDIDSKATESKVRSRNPVDDPYGRAYIKALSVARSKEMRADSLHFSQRITRPFTFSYFCHKDICQCGNCPPKSKKKRKKSDRKTGFKAIFGDVNVYDYFKWPND